MVFVVNQIQSHGKIAFRVNAKAVLYQINVILSNNAKFDVMIVTSRRHNVNIFCCILNDIVGKTYMEKITKGIFKISLCSKVTSKKVRNMGHYPIDMIKTKKKIFKINGVHITGFVWYCSLITNI